jgi:hypothetical protein
MLSLSALGSSTTLLDAVAANECRLAVKNIHTELNTTEATNNAQMDIDDQPTLNSHTITDLINQKTSQQNKPMRSDITQIKKQLNSLLSDSKNPPRGPHSASRKTKTPNKRKKLQNPAIGRVETPPMPTTLRCPTAKTSRTRTPTRNQKGNLLPPTTRIARARLDQKADPLSL